MTLRTASVVLLALAMGATGLAQAGSPDAPDFGRHGSRHEHSHERGEFRRGEYPPRESYTEESTRKMADGRVFKRKVEQKADEGGFSRREELTNPDGKTATRSVSASFDKDKQSWSRKVEGTGFDGKTWSRSAEGHGERDESGFGGRDGRKLEPSAAEPAKAKAKTPATRQVR